MVFLIFNIIEKKKFMAKNLKNSNQSFTLFCISKF